MSDRAREKCPDCFSKSKHVRGVVDNAEGDMTCNVKSCQNAWHEAGAAPSLDTDHSNLPPEQMTARNGVVVPALETLGAESTVGANSGASGIVWPEKFGGAEGSSVHRSQDASGIESPDSLLPIPSLSNEAPPNQSVTSVTISDTIAMPQAGGMIWLKGQPKSDSARIGEIRARVAGEVASLDYERWYGEDIPYVLAEMERLPSLECCLFQMQEAAKDLAEQLERLRGERDVWMTRYYNAEEFLCSCNINRKNDPAWNPEWTYICEFHKFHPDDEEVISLAERAEKAEAELVMVRQQLVDMEAAFEKDLQNLRIK